MNAGVEARGLKDVIRDLKRFGVEAADLKASFRRIGGIVANEAKLLAPHRSGRLAGTIRPSNTQNKSIVRAGAGIKYAGVQNYGGYNNITGKHFMERALQAKQGEAVQQLETELRGLIRGLDLN